jgi:hypothetical protein
MVSRRCAFAKNASGGLIPVGTLVVSAKQAPEVSIRVLGDMMAMMGKSARIYPTLCTVAIASLAEKVLAFLCASCTPEWASGVSLIVTGRSLRLPRVVAFVTMPSLESLTGGDEGGRKGPESPWCPVDAVAADFVLLALVVEPSRSVSSLPLLRLRRRSDGVWQHGEPSSYLVPSRGRLFWDRLRRGGYSLLPCRWSSEPQVARLEKYQP